MNVFISYKSEDKDALLIRDTLIKNGISVWMAPESIPTGSNYIREISGAIDACEVFLLVLSQAAQESSWILAEVERAFKKKKLIIPFVTERLTLNDEFDFLISRSQRIDAYAKRTAPLDELVLRIKSLVKYEDTSDVKADDNALKKLWYSGAESDWKSALGKYYDKLGQEQAVIENYFDRLDLAEVEAMNSEAFYDFLYNRYFVWKYTQKNRLATTRGCLRRYLDNGELSKLESIKERLFSASRLDIEKCLGVAEEIYGLGTAGASGLLSVLFPESFGTVDQFVVKSLCKIEHPVYNEVLRRMNPDGLKKSDGVILVNIMREKSSELNLKFNTAFWTPRKMDMILWSFGR